MKTLSQVSNFIGEEPEEPREEGFVKVTEPFWDGTEPQWSKLTSQESEVSKGTRHVLSGFLEMCTESPVANKPCLVTRGCGWGHQADHAGTGWAPSQGEKTITGSAGNWPHC